MLGNSTADLEHAKGHYLASLRLKPIVQQFKAPVVEGGSKDSSEDGVPHPDDLPTAGAEIFKEKKPSRILGNSYRKPSL